MFTLLMDRPTSNIVESVKSFFMSVYSNDWFEDNLVKRIVKDIDRSEYFGNGILVHEDFGPITVNELSAGSKTLILMLKYKDNDKVVYKLSNLGDNCFKFLEEFPDNINCTLFIDNTIKSEDGTVKYLMKESNVIVDNYYDFFKELANYGRFGKY